MAFGQWLKRQRQALDLTREALAERVGCAPSTLQKMEQGVRRPSRAMAERLLDALNVPPSERALRLQLARRPVSPTISAADSVPAQTASPSKSANNAVSGDGTAESLVATDAPPSAQGPDSRSARPLVLTKILPPPPRQRTVPRQRLSDILDAERDGGLTLVVAPAGFGKTTLLTAWIAGLTQEQGGLVAWLSLEEGDNDVVQVIRYLIAALQRCRPMLGGMALQLLDTPQQPIESVLTVLVNDLVQLEPVLHLVLEDFHLVRAPAVHQAFRFLIDHLPPQLHLIVVAREDPPLPLARLRARQQVHEIRAADLRFTRDEVAAFFTESIGLALDAAEIVALEQYTEGWVAGLQFAALALRDRTDRRDVLRSFTGSHRLVLDYLVEEVLSGLPEHLHTFLLSTSILDRLCGPLCDALLGLESAGAQRRDENRGMGELGSPISTSAYSQIMLEELERANLFLTPLDDERHWYRYHHLFGAALRERLHRGATPTMVSALHKRASRWFSEQRQLREAIDHALEGRHWRDAARLIEQIGDRLVGEGAIDTLQHMIALVPSDVRSEHPRLLYLFGLCARQRWDLDWARMLFQQASEAFAALGDAVGRGESLVYLADCLRMLGVYDEARASLDQALAAPLPPGRRAIALRSQAYQAGLSGDWQQAMTYLDETLDLLERSGDRQALFELAVNLRSLFLALPGAVERAERVRRLLHQGSVVPLSALAAVDHFLKGFILVVRGEIPAARVAFEQALRLSEQFGAYSQLSMDVALYLLRITALFGAFDTAHQHADRIIMLLREPTLTALRRSWGGYYLSAHGWLYWLEQRYDHARQVLDDIETGATDQEWPPVKTVRRLLRSLVLVAAGDYSAAGTLLGAVRSEQQQFRDSVVFADAGLLLAFVYHQTDRTTDALAVLDDVLGRHAQANTPGLIIFTGPPIVAPLLHLAIQHHVHAEFARNVLRAMPNGSQWCT
ncbi:MAG: helix-turn-helix domain-containing protein [Chloroflexales bacterium]|nr:helix-turn-helix domain-containing protein [Chloroflexales bacterium]